MTIPKSTPLKRRDVFKLLDRDCVNPMTKIAVKAYINRLVAQSQTGQKNS